MQIVTDRGADLSPEQQKDLNIHFVPLFVTLDGKTYGGTDDIQPEEYYQLLSKTKSFPTTSQPSPENFSTLYSSLAKEDDEILSIHISSGLSGTIESAQLGASLVPNAKITIIDSKTLSCPLGWQVEMAARAVKSGWKLNQIIEYLTDLREKVDGIFTLADMKYLIHGGRINHIQSLMASILKIKPVIGIDKITGKYVSLANETIFNRALKRIVDLVSKKHPEGSALKIQGIHGNNLDGVAFLQEEFNRRFRCTWLPTVPVAPILGSHTGPSLVGISVAALDAFAAAP